MSKRISIGEAKSRFLRIIRDVEAGGTITLTRHGEPVAVVLSKAEYDRLRRRKPRVQWGAATIDTRHFKFDREEANAR
jgi:prevent-host-death family protein